MSMENRLQPEVHSALPWRLNEIASDFELIDAWAVPAIGRRDQFPLLLSTMAANLTPSRRRNPRLRRRSSTFVAVSGIASDGTIRA